MTTSPDYLDAARLGEIMAILAEAGCTSASIFLDGTEVVIDGCVPSYEAKERLQELVGALVGSQLRNSLRVYPN